jgi:hypothetical protein
MMEPDDWSQHEKPPGLYGLVRDQLLCDPLSGHLFLFSNSQRNRHKALKGNPLHLIKGDLIVAPVIEPCGPRGLMASHLLGDLELAAVLKVGGYFCPTPRNGLIDSEDCCCLLSLLSVRV